MPNKFCVIILFWIICSLSIEAQDLFESLTSEKDSQENESSFALTGYVRGSAYGGADDFDFSNLFGEFALQGRLSGGNTLLYGDARIRNGLFFDDRQTILELKEAYAAYRDENVSFYLGNQIVSWGRTDGFNPTNNITPNDYFFLTPEPDDRLMSNFMLRSKIRFTQNTELNLIAIPVFKKSNYRYDLFDMGDEAHFVETVIPEVKLKNSSFAARMSVDLPAIGFSASYFHGYDPFYGFRVEDVQILPTVSIDYIADFYKKDAIGADFVLPVQNSIVRGEIAYNHTDDYRDNMHIPNPDLSYVFGFEHRLFEITSIFQYVGKYTFDFEELEAPTMPFPFDQDAMYQYAIDRIDYESNRFNSKVFHQQEEFNHAFMINLNRFFAYETIEAGLTGYYNITSEEYMIRPNVNWKLTDELTANAGASLMYGKDESIYDMAGKVLNGVYISLKASF